MAEPLLDGDWDGLWAALNAYRLQHEANGVRWVQSDGEIRNSFHSNNVSNIFRNYIKFQSDEPCCLFIEGSGGGSGLSFDQLADITIQLFRTNLEVLRDLCKVGFSAGTCPMRIFVDLGSLVDTASITDRISVQAPAPMSWWAPNPAFDDPKPLGGRSGSRLQIEFEADFQLMSFSSMREKHQPPESKNKIRAAFKDLEIAFLAIGLCRKVPMQIFWSHPTIQYIGWSVALGVASSVRIHSRTSSDYTKLSSNDIASAQSIISKGHDASDATLRRLWIPASKLFSASASNCGVDELVDFRTALEAFFIGDEKGELIYRLSTRFARIGAQEVASRQKLLKAVKRVYGWGSTAVHSGELDSKFRVNDFKLVVEVLRDQIVAALDSGIPKWDEFDLT